MTAKGKDKKHSNSSIAAASAKTNNVNVILSGIRLLSLDLESGSESELTLLSANLVLISF